mmetsp:Transcript_59762/g.142194  ORF Transcript_59762/g.142194 Transcript_59762/m.142194 type:complete len:143 (+) Transcript_59762:144-572(+)|eukprot:CAMPEP_0178383676 /NCGR_PEP_ID=MMETSP0689_2-20121128/7122_1 /TAXON_ID=160604 /ORGANISM="Amphidinium massartii, Strain CS-259" /LENGTH=142 /DNA_ID=CAMNT_0020003899 /DNA_START=126 /DNA_END=554 /DNA_ORIENTATION=+
MARRHSVGAFVLIAHALLQAQAGPTSDIPAAIKVTTSSFSEWRGIYDLEPDLVQESRPVFRQRRGPGMLYHACGSWRISSDSSFPTCGEEDTWAVNPFDSGLPLWPMHRDGWNVLFKYEHDYGVWREDPWFAVTKYSPCLGI